MSYMPLGPKLLSYKVGRKKNPTFSISWTADICCPLVVVDYKHRQMSTCLLGNSADETFERGIKYTFILQKMYKFDIKK